MRFSIARSGLLLQTQNALRIPRRVPVVASFVAVLSVWTSAAVAQTGLKNTVAPDAKTLLEQARQIDEGKMLFTHNWRIKGNINKTGDGLGPMFNAESCAVCHTSPSLGGAGKLKHNVDILSIQRPVRSSARLRAARQNQSNTAGREVHPGFTTGRTSLVLHKYRSDMKDYAEFRGWFLKPELFENAQPVKINGKKYSKTSKAKDDAEPYRYHTSLKKAGVPLEVTRRNTPALYGAGIIDRIPDGVFIEVAEWQRKKYPGISGRIPQTNTGAVGRFGWRGQSATLHDFVLGACANELGLTVPGQVQPTALLLNEKTKRWEFKRTSGSPPLDLTEAQCRSMTAYIASLPAPQRAKKLPLQMSIDAHKGEKLFHAVGCAACHMPNMGPAKGIFSDLLLHDMGERLSDPLAAVPEINEKTAPGFTGSFGYYGSEAIPQIANITTNIRQEWRTPPLWGVADSAPYLHDGRAATLEEAIRWHDGEARKSRLTFQKLPVKERDQLILFLQTLVAPGSSTRPAGFGPAVGTFFSVK